MNKEKKEIIPGKTNNSKTKIILTALLIYIFSSISSFAIFSLQAGPLIASPTPAVQNGEVDPEDDGLPKTEQCSLNGALYSKKQKNLWEKRRPLGVMIENHEDSRPQSGLTSADVIYEAVAEGGITRFLAVFYCKDAKIIGPVRSARTYFLDYISEHGNNPLYAHVGGANTPGPADALSQIENYGWAGFNDLNQFSIPFPTFWQDKERLGREVATEHTMYSSTEKLWKYAKEKRNLTDVDEDDNKWDDSFIQYKFKKDEDIEKRPESQSVSFDFWEGYSNYSVKWDYEKSSNSYLRFNGGEKHIDKNNDKQLKAKNIVILFERESNANDGYENNLHMLYGTKGTGDALVFMDGKQIEATWSKKDRESRTILEDNNGDEIEFNPGQIWFEILAIGTDVLVK